MLFSDHIISPEVSELLYLKQVQGAESSNYNFTFSCQHSKPFIPISFTDLPHITKYDLVNIKPHCNQQQQQL